MRAPGPGRAWEHPAAAGPETASGGGPRSRTWQARSTVRLRQLLPRRVRPLLLVRVALAVFQQILGINTV
ncbi:MAG TPA: hypothetical protein VMD28_09520, partial [Acidimicrobiales bacterium]|nr:hypothetical protein [Acidimicrobiales bacterium]